MEDKKALPRRPKMPLEAQEKPRVALTALNLEKVHITKIMGDLTDASILAGEVEGERGK